MGRLRKYASAAEKQAAWRHNQAQTRLRQIHMVQGEGYTVYQGDALALVPLLGSFDHCITDPPYEQEAHTRTRRTRAVLEGRAPYAHIDFAPITPAQRRFLARLTCQWLLAFCQAEAVGKYQDLLGPKYKRPLFWRKRDGTPQMSGDRPAMGYETIASAWCQPGRPRWNRGGKRGWYDTALPDDVVIYDYLVKDGEARLHATQKPVAFMRELVRDFTQPGDLILDPFMGSGSTGVACLEEGRRFVGIELAPSTFATACQRLAQSAPQKRLFVQTRPARQARLL